MDIVHLSDTHLGYSEFHRIDPDTGINQREQDVYNAFISVVDRILDLEPDLVVHSGDLFDNVRPKNRAVNLATEQFSRLSEAGIKTVLIAGNHDTPKIATTGTITRALDRLPHIEAVTSDPGGNGSGYRKIPVGDMLVHAVSDAPTENELTQRIESLKPDPGYNWNVLVLHAGIRALAGKVFSGEFNEHHVDRNVIEGGGFDYVALGHYHKRMEVNLSSDTLAVYSGAPERFSFNESSYRPGFLRVHFRSEEVSYEEEPIETRNFVNLGTVDGEELSLPEIHEEIESRLPEKSELVDSMISLKVKGIDPNSYLLLEERLLDDLRDRAFETSFQVIGRDELGEDTSSLAFSDLRIEFSNFIKDRANIPENIEPEKLIETGQKYLGIALGEEDEG